MNEKKYWDDRWERNETGWDIGYPSPAIVNYLATITDKTIKILIPGCGNAYEAKSLVDMGFKNITLLDISQKAVELVRERFTEFPEVKILCEDFFKHNDLYDLIVEQTFFCAIPPIQRPEYVDKMHQLLHKGGKLVGLLFNRSFPESGPPYGGTVEEYRQLFSDRFDIIQLDENVNSIPQRRGSEVFIEFIRREHSTISK